MTVAPLLPLDEQSSLHEGSSSGRAPRENGTGLQAIGEPDTEGASGSPPSTMLALIDRYVRDPGIDVDKFERLLAAKERMDAHEARRQYNEAMNLAQNEIQPVARATQNTATASWYAKLEAVDAAIRPIYLRHGFSISRNTIAPLVGGNIRVEVTCSHLGGHFEKFHREGPPDTMGPKGTPTKTALHGGGSSETFMTRYTVCGIFNVVFKDMDDDGNGGPISAEEVVDILTRMEEAKVNNAKFLKYMRLPATVGEIVALIPKSDLGKALLALEELSKRPANADPA